MGRKISSDGHHALLSKGKEDEMEIFGYKTQGFRRALCLCGSFFSFGGLWLLFSWKPEWDVWANCAPCDLEEADTLLLRTTDEFKKYMRKKVIWLELLSLLESEKLDGIFDGDRESVISRAIARPGLKVRCVQVQKVRYAWDTLEKAFVRVGSLEDNTSCYEVHQKFGEGLTRKQRDVRKVVCGPNTMDVEVRPVWKLLLKEIVNPFYLFQDFTLILWLAQGYLEYSIAIIVLTGLSIGLTVYDLRQQSVKLHNLVKEYNKVRVVVLTKDEGSHTSESRHLVPGDVLLLEGQKLSLPCDAILIDGGCVVDEGMLTGESVPVTKTPLPHIDNTVPWRKHCGEDYRRHVLFCGTEVIQTRRSGNGPARAVVLQTGFNTAKGDLMRSILYPKPLNFRLYKEAFKFIVCLALVGILGLIYAACVYVSHKEPVGDTVAMALLLMTIAIPPAIPAALTTGVVYAQRRLKKKKVFCISPQRINICGQINLVCFDKTGTLTEDGLDLWGFLPCENQSFQPVHRFSGRPLPWGPLCQAMATCHSLLLLDGKIQGDPMDLKMFEGSGWELEEERCAGAPEACVAVVKPGPAASQAPLEGMAILRQFPFSSSLLRMSVITQELGKKEDKDACHLYMKGAPEVVASLCQPMTVPPNFKAELRPFTSQGFRVIALAHKELLPLERAVSLGGLERDQVESSLTFLGLLIMENRLKSETKPVLEELSCARIRSVMVTGDHLETAVTVARTSGMVSRGSRVILVEAVEAKGEHCPVSIAWRTLEDAQPGMEKSQDPCITVDGKSDFHFALDGKTYQLLQKYFSTLLPKILVNGTVFARMPPAQKSSLIEEFQKLDYYVGMCGDGANDCAALKMAHAGIALSDQEASVASPFTSQIPNIECVPQLIREGRAALVSSFAVFKYLALYGMAQFIGTSLLFWQTQIFGNYQYLLQDVCITLVVCLTMSLNHAYPKLAPHRPPGRLLAPSLLLSIILNVCFTLAVQVFAFLFVKQQPWYSQLRSHRGCPSGSHPLFPGDNGTMANATEPEEHRVLSYEDTTLCHLVTLNCLIVAFVFSKGRPFRKPIYTNYVFSCLLGLQLGVSLFLVFADIEVVYKGMELLCIPTIWKAYLLVMLAVTFGVSLFVEDAILQNYRLWLWIKALFRFRSSSRYRRLQRRLERDTTWPPTEHGDVAAERKSQAYANPVYENSEEN